MPKFHRNKYIFFNEVITWDFCEGARDNSQLLQLWNSVVFGEKEWFTRNLHSKSFGTLPQCWHMFVHFELVGHSGFFLQRNILRQSQQNNFGFGKILQYSKCSFRVGTESPKLINLWQSFQTLRTNVRTVISLLFLSKFFTICDSLCYVQRVKSSMHIIFIENENTIMFTFSIFLLNYFSVELRQKSPILCFYQQRR